ncbi:peroxiredoxin [Novispirillum sp. DQ9]|uniref:peroxiredoxin n=1 Tax=Novispirillum sp. DQ9 TaxID=3398612 RepID=UPI003C7D56A1
MIKTGDTLPSLSLKVVDNGEMGEATTDALFGQGRHVLFGLPGAFTPTCSAKHLPGYVEKAEALRAKGIGRIACMAVNDAFVMKAWAQTGNAGDILMIADGSALFTKALGLELDLTDRAMGLRCQRFALVIADGVVEQVFVEAAGDFSVSSAEHVLRAL